MDQEYRRIERLDNLTANQIAAGEVVERPVSVVKELVENAIDAGGDRIVVEFRDGGLSMIRVTDNGAGMDKEDLLMAVERHATSKIRRIRDLDDLTTLGFRGEALASIASVASLEIETRRAGDNQGHRLLVKGSDERPVIGVTGCPGGTSITTEQLFFNTPARLKFMKSPGYEGGQIHDLMIQFALGYPHIGFRLENQGKVLFDTGQIGKTEDMVELFYGKDARQALVPVDGLVSKGRLSGWVTAAPYSRGTRKGFHFFINGRRIQAKEMQWAVERAFERLLPKGRFPLAILSFQLPGNLLDVNVHPGKLEVRINDADLNPSLTRALRIAVSGGQLMPDGSGLGAAPAERPEGRITRDEDSLYHIAYHGEMQLDAFLRDSGAGETAAGSPGAIDGRMDADAEVIPPSGGGEQVAAQAVLAALEAAANEMPAVSWGVESHNRSLQALAAGLRPEDFIFGPQISFTVAGQLHRTFILAEVDAGLLIVDQHVAHERILYEQYLAKSSQNEAAQMLMQPVQVNLTTGEEEILIRHILTLSDLGLVVERFGARQYLIRSEPAGQSVDQAMFKELLEHLGDDGRNAGIEGARQALLVMNACKAAVKANTPLRPEEMKALLDGLRKTSHPMTCPHGRPIMYLLPYRRLIQAFGRSS